MMGWLVCIKRENSTRFVLTHFEICRKGMGCPTNFPVRNTFRRVKFAGAVNEVHEQLYFLAGSIFLADL